ncbi:hypothetical protein [Tahibacter harae]|uniref:AlgX/AlgJ SGNH hydrolase-like domain-containing protein n=1 Tax=Tahibacter harae TaxID=2963937 RepID=A0ABT1QYP4_9GAMM|nr:hypothetical protein [Tahibacter harae]MCQ4167375.1 hypothetical protein [Tahibacter harae]
MTLITTRARILTSLLAVLLLLPVAGIRLQDPIQLRFFHSRTLNELPQADSFAANPVEYFRQARGWLADRIYPIVQASMLHKKIQYYVLHTPPQRRVTLGDGGYIFLNGGSDSSLNETFETTCIGSHQEALATQLVDALRAIGEFARQRGMALDIVIVPTSGTLYGDHLPASVPRKYREACAARATGDSPLLRFTPPPGVIFSFPFPAMREARDVPGFFPKGNWHAQGMSLKVVRDAYLAARNVAPPPSERLTLTQGPSEIMATYGIDVPQPVYLIQNDQVLDDPPQREALARAVSDLFIGSTTSTHAYVNRSAALDESVLMVSDSYGEAAASVYAASFRELGQILANNLPPENVATLVERGRSLRKTDRLMLLLQEGSVYTLIVWSKAFAAAPPPAAAATADAATAP